MPRSPDRRRSKLRPRATALVVLATALQAACAGSIGGRENHVLTVTNQLGRTIQEIRAKTCDQLEIEAIPLPDSKLASGETRRFDLPEHCLDLIAYDTRGRVVGEQRDLHMLPGASWVLRR